METMEEIRHKASLYAEDKPKRWGVKNTAAIAAAYEDGYLDGSPKWIPCSEKLPNDCKNYLLLLDNGSVRIEKFMPKLGHFYFPNTTHWMQLPPIPPK